MLRYIIISILVVYLINKLSQFLLRAAGRPQQPPNAGRPDNGSVNMNTPPKKKKSGLKGGEYVDYEEVK